MQRETIGTAVSSGHCGSKMITSTLYNELMQSETRGIAVPSGHYSFKMRTGEVSILGETLPSFGVNAVPIAQNGETVAAHITRKIRDAVTPGTVIKLALQGNIGSGKSTALEMIRAFFAEWMQDAPIKLVVAEEPINEWLATVAEPGVDKKEWKGHLDHFYADKKKRAAMFQVVAISSRVKAFREAYKQAEYWKAMNYGVILLSERSASTDLLFAECNTECGNLDAVETHAYHYFVREALEANKQSVDCNLYVCPPLEKCIERIKSRNRGCEQGIDVEYMRKLHEKHDIMFVERNTERVHLFLNEDNADKEELQKQVMWTLVNTLEKVCKPGFVCSCESPNKCVQLLEQERDQNQQLLRASRGSLENSLSQSIDSDA